MLSVIIIAKNEEANIRKCLQSVSWASEIIVLDSGSTDNTVAIAREFTERVYLTDWQGYGIQKQRALSYATGDWILNIDADESVDEHLKQLLIEAMNDDVADAYRIPICMSFYGKKLRYSSSPKRHIRMFKREGATYSSDLVHEKIILPKDARIGKVKAPILHHCYQDVKHVLYKINHYSSCSSKIRTDERKYASLLKTLLGSAWMFFRCYFVQFGFLDGREGLLFAIFNAHGSFYRGIKQLYPDK